MPATTDPIAAAVPKLRAEVARLARAGYGGSRRATQARAALAVALRPAPKTFSDVAALAGAVAKLEAAVPRLLALGEHDKAATVCRAIKRLKGKPAKPATPTAAAAQFSDRPAPARAPSPVLLTADPAALRAMGAEKRYELYQTMTAGEKLAWHDRQRALTRAGQL